MTNKFHSEGKDGSFYHEVESYSSNSGSTINVNFSDGNDKGSDLVVVSTFGAAVLSYHVPAGQSSTQIQANISAGMYCISRLQKNKAAETKKIIVK